MVQVVDYSKNNDMARLDLHSQNIFEGDRAYSWGDIGCTFVVDPCNGVGGQSTLDDENSFYRKTFYPRFIKEKIGERIL